MMDYDELSLFGWFFCFGFFIWVIERVILFIGDIKGFNWVECVFWFIMSINYGFYVYYSLVVVIDILIGCIGFGVLL